MRLKAYNLTKAVNVFLTFITREHRMAKFIERIVEPVIEDPVIDILAEPVKGSPVASLLPRFNLGPIGRHGRPHPRDAGVLREEQFSIGSDTGERAASPGREIQPDDLSFPLRSGTPGENDAGWSGLASSRPSGLSSDQIASLYGGTLNSDDTGGDAVDHDEGVPGPTPDSDDDTSPDGVSDASGATIFGTEGDDIIDVQFVFPAEIQTEPGTLDGTTHNADVVNGNGGDDTVNGGGGDDVIDGGSGDDTLNGDAGHDMLSGGSGDDTLDGGSGDDVLSGGSGDDVLSGGDGNDELTGGTGTDQLIGGGGADRFVFGDVDDSPAQAPDLVFDFNKVQGDQIDVSGIDAISGTTEIDEFIFVGDDAFGGSAGELRFVHDGPDGLLEGDVNGDATADFTIELLGVTSLSGDDIMGLG
jgi:Ca2+-binding RTX toxin-like protein